LSLFIGFAISMGLAEIVLRIVNPSFLRVVGNRIYLAKNVQYNIKNNYPSLDSNILHKRNSLGFRGENPPKEFEKYLTIITIGGSTTECYYLSEGKTWPDILGKKLSEKFNRIWVNNAGLDGHSTYGHLILLRDVVSEIKPKLVLFLIGINDLGLSDCGTKFDIKMQRPNGIISLLAEYLKVFALADNMLMWCRAQKLKLAHNMDHNINSIGKEGQYEENQDTYERELKKYKNNFLPRYEENVKLLAENCRAKGIEPVLITQAALYGRGKDQSTGTDLEKINVGNTSGKLKWATLDSYNDVLRKVAKEKNIPLVDLGKEMPKDSRYFYDFYHFSNAGAEKAGEIVAEKLEPFLAGKFPEYKK